MKHARHLLTLAAAAAVLAACSKKQPEVAAAPPPPVCAFQDGAGPYTTPAPNWVCDERYDGVPLTAVSSYRQSATGYDFMVEMATARARQKLAAIISSKALGSTKDYRASTGTSVSNETAMATAELTQKTLTEALLTGSRVLTKTRNPNTGQVYVLVGITEDGLPKIAEKAAEAAFMSDSAEFQRFKASQSFKELTADLQKP